MKAVANTSDGELIRFLNHRKSSSKLFKKNSMYFSNCTPVAFGEFLIEGKRNLLVRIGCRIDQSKDTLGSDHLAPKPELTTQSDKLWVAVF